MGKVTGISWTDHTFNPWWGCTKVSAGCDNCYAEAFDHRVGGSHWGKGEKRREFGDKHWNEPLRWNKDHEKEGTHGLVFCASMADVMDDEAPEGARERLWDLIDKTPNLIWQLLSKRPQRYERYLPTRFCGSNRIWLGATCEDQENYILRWPVLARACEMFNLRSWISYEPALGPLELCAFPVVPTWVIFGGESGPGFREAKREWLDDLVKEIAIFVPHVKLFVKQMSARTPNEGKALIPADRLIQQFPNSTE